MRYSVHVSVFYFLHGWSYDKYAGHGVNLNGMCAATARVCVVTGPQSGRPSYRGLFPGGPGPPPSLLFIGYLGPSPRAKATRA